MRIIKGPLIMKRSIPIHLIHDDLYSGWVFEPAHPTQGRRFNNAKDFLLTLSREENLEIVELTPRLATSEELERVHSPKYVREVIKDHVSNEWQGIRPDLSQLATLFAGGTLEALRQLLEKEARLAVHFAGAKHHALFDRSSGFCIFNDFALAAEIATKDYGLNLLILDIDAHHGDGVEFLLADNYKAVTFSIHQRGIFPGTGEKSVVGNFYNFPLEPGATDKDLLEGVDSFIGIVGARERIWDWTPDILFITCGADGHEEDPLTGLKYTVEGYIEVARRVRDRFRDIPILVGGAGGYLPDSRTPEIWSKFVAELARFN